MDNCWKFTRMTIFLRKDRNEHFNVQNNQTFSHHVTRNWNFFTWRKFLEQLSILCGESALWVVGTKTRCAASRGEAWKFVSWTPFSSNRDLALVTSTRHSVPPLRRETERQTGRRGESTSRQAARRKAFTQWRQESPRGGVGKTLVKCMDIKILYAVLPRESTLTLRKWV